ncbi:uncharacterized protein LOC129225301 [Uloborus diversus]|uniref:uncharacterized protein LOC129225301 n=1 Tax=Uloborus diversus TaxID=327109 RepID=UPI002409F524|nr:uncharacterized protein LOC129225301 [Uloborus diversus]
MVMEINLQYKNLLKQIVLNCKSTDLIDIKKHFSACILSSRAVSKVTTVQDFLSLLEKRDIINPQNVAALYVLGELLKNSKIQHDVRTYKKLNDTSTKCDICNTKYDFQCTYHVPPENQKFEDCNGYNNNCKDLETKNEEQLTLEEAIENVSFRIGSAWRELASELKVKEFQVDIIRRTYPNDFVQQARKMLKLWCDNNRGNINLEMLKKALEARLCKRKGIGVHLMEPIIGYAS